MPSHSADYPEYEIGDIVTIFPDSPDDNMYGWNSQMDEFVGVTTHVTDKSWDSFRRTYNYKVDADGGEWYWSSNCFVRESNILKPIYPRSDEELLTFLSIR